MYLSNFKKSWSLLSSPLSHNVSLDEMTANLKEWKKYSTISTSHRNVNHCKSFSVSDRNENDQEHIVFDSYILQTINIILNATSKTGAPLTRWLPSTVAMIEMIQAIPHINDLQVTNIYATDYTLLLKFFWPNKTTKYTVVKRTLCEY